MFSYGQTKMLWAIIFFALMFASVKKLPHIPFLELVFFRSVISFILCLHGIKKNNLPTFGTNKKLLFLRGLAGALALSFYFYLLQVTPLATAVSLQYLSPIFTVIIASFLLKEKLKLNQWFYFIMAFAGVLLIKGFNLDVTYYHVLIGACSALGSGIAYNLVRILRKTEHPLIVVFYFPLVTLPICLPFTIFQWVTPVGIDWLYILAIGIFTQIAQVNMTIAYQHEQTYKISILNYLGLLLALIIGYVFFNETIDLVGLLGMALIVSAVVLISKSQNTIPQKSGSQTDE